MKPIRTMVFVSAILWASAIVASAILRAPTFLTLVLLPMLGVLAVSTIATVGRRMARPAQTYL